jgi:hypothetical protein
MALRVLAPVAVVLLAAGGYGLSLLAGGPSGHGTAASSAGSARPGVRAEAPATGGGAARGAAPLPAESTQPRAKPQFMSPHRFTVVISNTDYRRGTLRQQLEAELHAAASARPAQAPSAQLMACVRRVTSDANPVYVESASFEGRPATIIVAWKSTSAVAWVAGAGCSGANPHLLDRTTLPPGI